ncbi:NAD(P)H-dependent oxidoreductase [Nitratireductor kimnyeongensis]|uniref:NAD(P)H-dependent oxidoreductase n=1 Tax=Nitratireductor kimnyeongensis TaxID=430679 RepID=A0ABW0TBW8_9HYPH|nr:NAD(P)H-dependent oxidoreductase [Nitratireductor kimnyeongensis]QZZ35482.1 NAD(P)H-dependent oxidoreductase [Nitratireductor kimnyeongensis]
MNAITKITPDIQTQIIEAFNFRHATKVFDAERKIDAAAFQTILEAARLSPTSFGHEPFKVLVIQTPEKRELFREYSWGANGMMSGSTGQLGTASHFGIILASTAQTMTAGSDYLQDHYRNVKNLPDEVIEIFNGAYGKFQATDHDITTDRQISDWAGKQAYIVLANMMTAGALMGIDSCPIEGFDMARTTETLRDHFGVDTASWKPAVMFAFGYRAKDPEFPKTRRTMAQTVSWF